MISSKLRDLRKSKNMSLKTLGEHTGISITFLSDIEHGRGKPSIDTLKAISNAFNVSPSYFIDELNLEPILDEELLELIKDYSNWNDYDQQELICYLKVKKLLRNSKDC
ncbi:helix-turn-helix domain-containing protein [Metaclostridioides mangenotii]|uniref:helix-turn-helix domain-containing protein n=1 Tax=Metaclostridioides mangenotii TaxID=1540 RepID=UPI0026F26CDC|nr:helix-turn-helix transcriptional regulator [Clostridioides mangenotii]